MVELNIFMENYKQELKANNITLDDNSIIKEWQEELFLYIKNGGKISDAMYNNLDNGQKYYLNKHYTIHGINIIK